MKILFLARVFPYPCTDGGRIRRYHLLRALASRHEVTFAGLQDDNEGTALEGIQELRKYCYRVVTFGRTNGGDHINNIKGMGNWWKHGLGRTLSSPLPELLRGAEDEELSALRELMTITPFDAYHFDGFSAIRYLPAVAEDRRRAYFSLDLPNVESINAKRQLRVLPTERIISEWRLMRQLDWLKLLYWERQLLKRFHLCSVCSEHDKMALSNTKVMGKTLVVPNGVDTSYFLSAKQERELEGRIVFCGTMSYEPNIDGAQYFCTEILPHIKKEMASATLWIVGKTPTPAVQKLQNPEDIVVTGSVSDVRPYLQESAVVAVPLRVGGGTRLKILEAMAMGKAVVSTSIGSEGLAVTHGENILICDDPKEFARTCVMLLQSHDRRRKLGDAARRLVCNHYDWKQIRAHFADNYGNAISGRIRSEG